MKLVSYLVPIELSKIDKFANELPTYYALTTQLSTTLKSTIWAAKNVEIQIKEKDLDNIGAREKSKNKEFSKSNKGRRFSKSCPTIRSEGMTMG